MKWHPDLYMEVTKAWIVTYEESKRSCLENTEFLVTKRWIVLFESATSN
jgi:hypothetical protein